MRREPGISRRRFKRTLTQALGLVEPAEHQRGATQGMIGPGLQVQDAPRLISLDELHALPEPVQCLACLAELRQNPSRVGGHGGKAEGDIPCTVRRDRVFGA